MDRGVKVDGASGQGLDCGRRCFRFVSVMLLAGLAVMLSGCVTPGLYREATEERDRLAAEVERLAIERDSLEKQFLDAQESYEDERVTRTGLATNLRQIERRASELDQNLASERTARIAAAEALAAREAELAKIQSTYDELVTDLEAEVSSGQIEIERLREGLRLNVSDDVLFATGSAELDSIGRKVLVKVAGQLASLGDLIEVRGHTDDRAIRGSLTQRYPTNWELAAARASRVVRLLEDNGIPGSRLTVVSRGPFDPVAPNDSSANRARNRRIEIRLLPIDSPGNKAAAEAARSASKPLSPPTRRTN